MRRGLMRAAMSRSNVLFRLMSGWADTEAQSRPENRTGTRNATRVNQKTETEVFEASASVPACAVLSGLVGSSLRPKSKKELHGDESMRKVSHATAFLVNRGKS